jgi:hypothetical protein
MDTPTEMDLVRELASRGRTCLFYKETHGSLRVIVRNSMGGHDYDATVKGLRQALNETHGSSCGSRWPI